jgi:hypothetical protein
MGRRLYELPRHAAAERVEGQKIHKLGENQFAGEH